MESKLSLSDRYGDEVLSDNTHANYCAQCEDCAFWGNGNDPFTNKYFKSNCDEFPLPGHKPNDVINNLGKCPFKVKRDAG